MFDVTCTSPVAAEESAKKDAAVLVDLDKSNSWLEPPASDVDAAPLFTLPLLLVKPPFSLPSPPAAVVVSAASLLDVIAPGETEEEAEAAASASMAAAMSGEEVTTLAAVPQPAAN